MFSINYHQMPLFAKCYKYYGFLGFLKLFDLPLSYLIEFIAMVRPLT